MRISSAWVMRNRFLISAPPTLRSGVRPTLTLVLWVRIYSRTHLSLDCAHSKRRATGRPEFECWGQGAKSNRPPAALIFATRKSIQPRQNFFLFLLLCAHCAKISMTAEAPLRLTIYMRWNVFGTSGSVFWSKQRRHFICTFELSKRIKNQFGYLIIVKDFF